MSYESGKGTEDKRTYNGVGLLCAAVTEARGLPGTDDFVSCPDGAEPTPGVVGVKQVLAGLAQPWSRVGKLATIQEPIPSQPR